MAVNHLEILCEEASMEDALQCLIPKILGDRLPSFEIHPFRGKPDLLKKLPLRLRGYANWLPDDWRIVVVVDRDLEDCQDLKRELVEAVDRAGLNVFGIGGSGHVLLRIAVEELEAWFIGDPIALHHAYPRMPVSLGTKSTFRDPDGVAGGTWEQLERVLQRRGYHKAGLAKTALARDVAPHMDVETNRSKSFTVFRDGLRSLVAAQ